MTITRLICIVSQDGFPTMGDNPTEKAVDVSASDASERAFARLRDVLAQPGDRRRIAGLTLIPEPTLKDYLSGRTSPNLDRFLLIAAAAGRAPEWFFSDQGVTPLPDRDDLVLIPRLDVEVAAGGGQVVDVVASIAELPFPREFVERMAPRGADLQCLQVRGDSMWPTIQDGAMIVIDLKQRELPKWQPVSRKAPRRPQKKDPIYVFNQSGQVRLKRLRDLGENFVAVISDNAEAHPPEIVRQGRDGGLKIIGKAVWWDVRA